jgi:DMSO/TMAO reductase YedYZ molybdopterin-dependent catalytic subunit
MQTTPVTARPLPPGQQLVAPGKWPIMGERGPRRDESPWQVTVCGAVGHRFTLSLDELQALPAREQTVDIHCVTRWSKPRVRFAGVPLTALVDRAQPAPDAKFVSLIARSDRQHSTSLPLADALALDALVALEVEGQPLPVEQGGPVRLVVPGRYFYKSLKWLERIELLAEDRLGYWESSAGYHNTADPWREERYIAATLSPAELRSILATRDWQGRHLLSLSAAGHDLDGLQAQQALLRNADFRECSLKGASFAGANLTNARFQQAGLRDADFQDADLEGANFEGADLRGASLQAASFLATTFCVPDAPHRGARLDATTRVAQHAWDQLAPAQQDYLRQQLQSRA